jgi:polysaccharide export outer membrane protein
MLGACSSAPFVWVTALPASDPRMNDTLRPGDKVQVAVRGQDALSGEFEVRPAGMIVLPVAGPVAAAGRTLNDLAADVTQRLRGPIAEPVVTIVLASRGPVSVGVIGEVRTPGRYDLAEREGVLHALARAGGLSSFANPDAIFVVRPEPGQRIRFRYSDLTAAQSASMRFRLTTGDVIVVE